MPQLIQRLSSIAVIFLLIFSGAWTAAERGDRVVGSMLIAAGLIVLGAWLAGEVRRIIREEEDQTMERRMEIEEAHRDNDPKDTKKGKKP